MKLQDILTAVQQYLPNADLEPIRRANAFARRHHEGQTRASGEPYIAHVSEVAFLATKLRLDVASIITAFLHDTVEDTDVKLEDIEAQFGRDVAQLVDGVTKLSQINFSSRAEQQAENFRKMLLAMAKDIRVLLIKLCDRLHNMRTLEFLSEPRRVRISQETMDIYAPLAHRLGIHWMKSELEDLSFRHLKPEMYEKIKRQVNKKKKERELYIKRVVGLIEDELEKHKLRAKVSGRPKHFYSIFHKMEQQDLNFDEIYDLIAFRVIVDSTMETYAALGVLHSSWKPIPGRFKDYIAMPKPNQYQSLHTTVIGPEGNRIEIQIRTHDMHDTAERGIAAHWIYKEGEKQGSAKIREGVNFSWLTDLVESERMLEDPYEFLSIVKEDLFPDEVYVFTPKGDVVALTRGATPIDFAYYIHSEVGHHCIGARANGQQVALSYQLQNGDAVEIVTSNTQVPNKDWLNLVATSKAKQRIRSWLKSQERTNAVAVGKELLGKDLRKLGLNLNKLTKAGRLDEVAEHFGFNEGSLLLAEIGYGKVSTNQIARRLLPDQEDLETKLNSSDSTLRKIFQSAAKALGSRSGIRVGGMDNVVFRFAHCCEPLPGDELVGYITRGRGVTIHSRNCTQTMSFDARRLVSVSWDDTVKTVRRVSLRVFTVDKLGLLAQLTQCISSGGANIVTAHVNSNVHGKALTTFDISVESKSQLHNIVRKLEALDGVLRVERTRRTRKDKAGDSGDD